VERELVPVHGNVFSKDGDRYIPGTLKKLGKLIASSMG